MALRSDRDKCAHLLRRFGLGASEAELDYYLLGGLSAAIDRLLDYDNIDEGFSVPIEAFKNPANDRVPMQGLVVWWSLRMLMSRRPLQETMTLFWHDHFATSGAKVNLAAVMHGQNEILRSNATGNFRRLLSAVSKDPAMIMWLDGQQNRRGHPNENFAREVMELFTLGIGHYTEADVKESARAYTGWAVRRVSGADGKPVALEFLDRPRQHDDTSKSFLGNTGNFNGDDILNILCDRPETAALIVRKMWSWFCYPNPEPGLVQKFAAEFRASGLEIKPLLRSIMASPEFYSAKAERAVVKNPVAVCIATLRQLGVGEMVGTAVRAASPDTPLRQIVAPAAGAAQAMKGMGMWLFYPPDVSGWKFGQAWISSATMLGRMEWAEALFSRNQSTRVKIRVPADQILAGEATSAGAVKALLKAFDITLSPAKLKYLVQAADQACGGSVTKENADETAVAICRLMFASPEFQMA